MAIKSVFDVARSLQMFFERVSVPPWSVKEVKKRWSLVDGQGNEMGVDFGDSDKPVPADAVDFIVALNWRPGIFKVQTVNTITSEVFEYCIVCKEGVSPQEVSGMVISVLHSSGLEDQIQVQMVSGPLSPAILVRDKHGVIPMCFSGELSYVPTITKLPDKKEYQH